MPNPKQSHFDLPFRFSAETGHVAVVEQDSEEDVMNRCVAVLKTPLGFRLELPDFGIAETVFEEGELDIEDIQAALEMWVEDAAFTVIDDPVSFDHLVRRVGIDVEIDNG